jgi:hypothetical protein
VALAATFGFKAFRFDGGLRATEAGEAVGGVLALDKEAAVGLLKRSAELLLSVGFLVGVGS